MMNSIYSSLCKPVYSDSVLFKLVSEIFFFTAPHLISLTNLLCMNKPDARQFERSLCIVDTRYPGVSPPVREYARIVVAKYIDVGSMNKIICEYILIASFVQWTNNSNIWWGKVILQANTLHN